ncbi:hypothetical protein [uncultured Delftia sp.]|uniref:hypothetical protein n=1 Tax=uncultured Delftia sp. TaxID=191464 RepID=UPI00338F360E
MSDLYAWGNNCPISQNAEPADLSCIANHRSAFYPAGVADLDACTNPRAWKQDTVVAYSTAQTNDSVIADKSIGPHLNIARHGRSGADEACQFDAVIHDRLHQLGSLEITKSFVNRDKSSAIIFWKIFK